MMGLFGEQSQAEAMKETSTYLLASCLENVC